MILCAVTTKRLRAFLVIVVTHTHLRNDITVVFVESAPSAIAFAVILQSVVLLAIPQPPSAPREKSTVSESQRKTMKNKKKR